MMQTITRGDFLRRLRHAGVAGQVQATQALEAFRLYMASEFPDIVKADYEPLYVYQKTLVIRSHNAALQQILREHEADIVQYVTQAAQVNVNKLQFRA